MDPVTHGLAGGLIGEAGFTQKLGHRARWLLPMVAMFPDIDIVYRIEGLPTYIANHRALTHSFVGILASGILIGAVAGRFDEERRYLAWISACWVALFSHQILDLITSYGTIVLYPFSRARFYFDWVFILDFFLTGIILVSYLLTRKKSDSKRQKIARTGLSLACGYVVFCALNHGMAMHQLRGSARMNQVQYHAIAAIPQPLLPFRWSGILDTGTHYYQAPMFSFSKPDEPFQVFTKTNGSFYEDIARGSELGALYTWFSRYPVITEKSMGAKHIVEFTDLRFYIRLHTFLVRKPFVLRITMDQDGKILESRFTRM